MRSPRSESQLPDARRFRQGQWSGIRDRLDDALQHDDCVTLDDFLQSEIDLGSFPSASYAVGTSSGIEHTGALGHAVVVPERIAATEKTIYDCASLTKPLITTTLILQAIEEGRIGLDDRFEGHTYRSLLTHTSGLIAWMPLYLYGDYRATIRAQAPAHPPGTSVVYSDLNFILLYFALQDLYGDYVQRASERIFEPLGLHDSMFRPASALRPRIAATEWGQYYEAKLGGRAEIAFMRPGSIWGETHDGNSFHAGGTAGNAGLFATAADVFATVQGFARGKLVSSELAREASRNHTAGLDDARGLGWQLGTGSAATSMLSSHAYGHTGFTGTSVWVEPESDRILVLLTNRVHPCAAPVAMQKIRGEFHRLAMARM